MNNRIIKNQEDIIKEAFDDGWKKGFEMGIQVTITVTIITIAAYLYLTL